MAFGVLAALLFLALPVLVVVLWMSRSGEGGGWSLRRFLQYTFLLAALCAAASGLTLLLEHALPVATRLAGRAARDLALGLSLSLVGVPVWLALWRVVWRGLAGAPGGPAPAPGERAAPGERSTLAWSLYLTVAASVSLLVALVHLVRVGTWALGAADFAAGDLAAGVVWGGVWLLHVWMGRQPSLAPVGRRADLAVTAGAAIGLVALALGAGGVLFYGLDQAYQAALADPLTDVATTDSLRRSLVLAALGSAVWWWHWLHQAAGAARTSLWHAHVVVLGILGGVLTATSGAAVALHAALEWLLRAPAAASAGVQFEVLPGALAAVAVGVWAWWYHRAVLLEDGAGERRERTEPERAGEHLVAAVGLFAAAGGASAAVVAVVQALAPAPLAAADPSGRNTLAAACTLLLVGVPLWARYWRGLQGRVRAGDTAELRSPSRRAYLFLVLGAGGLTAVTSVAVLLFVFFRELLEGTLGGTVLYDLRVALALALTAGGVSALHWTVYGEDRAARPGEPSRPRTVLLLSPDGSALAEEVAARTGARVRALRRLDGAPVPHGPVAEPGTPASPGPVARADAVTAAVLATEHEHVLVVVEAQGDVRAIPYEIR